MPVKKDLFQICASAAGILIVNSASVELDVPVDDEAKAWIPSLNAGGDGIYAIEAIVKKEVAASSTQKKSSRALKEADRRRLESSISPNDHRGLRILCDNVTKLEVTCDVDTEAGEFGKCEVTDTCHDVSLPKTCD